MLSASPYHLPRRLHPRTYYITRKIANTPLWDEFQKRFSRKQRAAHTRRKCLGTILLRCFDRHIARRSDSPPCRREWRLQESSRGGVCAILAWYTAVGSIHRLALTDLELAAVITWREKAITVDVETNQPLSCRIGIIFPSTASTCHRPIKLLLLTRRRRKQWTLTCTTPQMFPAVVSTKLEAAIEREERRKRRIVQAEHSSKSAVDKKGKRASEFEALLNEYSKMEAAEIAVSVFSMFFWLPSDTV